MILKKSYKNLFKLEARRNQFLFVITTIGVFMTLPFMFMQQISSFGTDNGVAFKHAGGNLLERRNNCLENITYDNVLLITMLFMLAVMNGVILFSFLNSKKKQDFYFSLPVNRKTLFWITYLQGIMNVVAAIGINVILTLGLAAMNNCLSMHFISMLMQLIIMALLVYLSIYSLCVLAFIISGKMMTSVLISIMFITYGAFMNAVLNNLFDGKLASMSVIPSDFYLISPYAIVIRVFGNDMDVLNAKRYATLVCGNYYIKEVVALVIMVAAAVPIARILFVKRNTEETGKALVFLKIKRGLKAVAVILAGLCVSCFFADFYEDTSLKASIAGLFIGVAISIFAIDLIFENSWKVCFRNWKKQILYIACSIAVFAAVKIYVGIYKYDGFQNTPDYTEKMALNENCVVLKDTDFDPAYNYSYELDCNCNLDFPIYRKVGNQDRLDEFIEQVSEGKQGKIRIVEMSSAILYNTSTDYIYDGKEFKVYAPDALYTDGTRYKYLVKVQGKLLNDSDEREYYVLTDQKNYTFKDFEKDAGDWERSTLAYVKCILAIRKEGGNCEK